MCVRAINFFSYSLLRVVCVFVHSKFLVFLNVYFNYSSSWLLVVSCCLSYCQAERPGTMHVEFSKSLLWQSVVVFNIELLGTSPTTMCQSPKFLIASICDLPDVNHCQFREFAATLLGPVHFLLPDQQSEIHCLIICAIQLLTLNNLGGTWRRICSPDIRSVIALEVLRNRVLLIDIYLLTYLLTDIN